jgi:hypothetical protein
MNWTWKAQMNLNIWNERMLWVLSLFVSHLINWYKNENQCQVFIGLARIWPLERIWILLANFPKMKSDFQRQELLLVNFPKMKSDFQRQGLLLANFPKNEIKFFKNSYMQCMKGPKVILG